MIFTRPDTASVSMPLLLCHSLQLKITNQKEQYVVVILFICSFSKVRGEKVQLLTGGRQEEGWILNTHRK